MYFLTDDSQGSNYGYSVTQPESPERAIEILRNLARLQLYHTGRYSDSSQNCSPALPTANIDKDGIVRILIENGGQLHAAQIESALNVARPTALRNMVELKAIGLVSLILAPYFANIQKLTDTESFSRIKEWVLKCNTVKELEPSISYFDDLINRATERVKDTGIRPLKFEETLQYKNRELYNMSYHDK